MSYMYVVEKMSYHTRWYKFDTNTSFLFDIIWLLLKTKQIDTGASTVFLNTDLEITIEYLTVSTSINDSLL